MSFTREHFIPRSAVDFRARIPIQTDLRPVDWGLNGHERGPFSGDPYYSDLEMKHTVRGDIRFMREVREIGQLVDMKRAQGLNVHVVIPTFNEGTKPSTGVSSVGQTIDNLRELEGVGLVDDIIVFDSDSIDDTEERVRERGVPFIRTSSLLRKLGLGEIRGKGANLWASVLAHPGDNDLLVFCDADFGARPSQIQAIASPLIEDPNVKLSLSVFRRLTHQGNDDASTPAVQGGRVTRLMFKPAVTTFFPEAAHLIEPIAGLYAGRGSSLAESYFPTDYRVETALVIDTLMMYGPEALSQVYCGTKNQIGQTTPALERMARQIFHEVLSKVKQYHGIDLDRFLSPEARIVQHPISQNGQAEIGSNVLNMRFVNLPAPATLPQAAK